MMRIDLHGLNEQGKLSSLFGNNDENLKYLSSVFEVKISSDNGSLEISAPDPAAEKLVAEIIEDLSNSIKNGYRINKKTFKYLIDFHKDKGIIDSEKLFSSFIRVGPQRGFVQAKTYGQQGYISEIKKNDLTICIGPAGTGKTYIGVARAVEALMEKEVSRIIVTRPAVEAGEKLGFLPGDIAQKVDPYLRPIFDALYEHMSFNKVEVLMEKGVIEVAPLAFMRGRTLNDSFIILDEGQNATIEQMKMFLTRTGHNSKVLVTGDITQIDIPNKNLSGLVVVSKILADIEGIKVLYLDKRDVVRHTMVQNIIEAFEKYDGNSKQ